MMRFSIGHRPDAFLQTCLRLGVSHTVRPACCADSAQIFLFLYIFTEGRDHTTHTLFCGVLDANQYKEKRAIKAIAQNERKSILNHVDLSSLSIKRYGKHLYYPLRQENLWHISVCSPGARLNSCCRHVVISFILTNA